jgi:hypothetical protein
MDACGHRTNKEGDSVRTKEIYVLEVKQPDYYPDGSDKYESVEFETLEAARGHASTMHGLKWVNGVRI